MSSTAPPLRFSRLTTAAHRYATLQRVRDKWKPDAQGQMPPKAVTMRSLRGRAAGATEGDAADDGGAEQPARATRVTFSVSDSDSDDAREEPEHSSGDTSSSTPAIMQPVSAADEPEPTELELTDMMLRDAEAELEQVRSQEQAHLRDLAEALRKSEELQERLRAELERRGGEAALSSQAATGPAPSPNSATRAAEEAHAERVEAERKAAEEARKARLAAQDEPAAPDASTLAQGLVSHWEQCVDEQMAVPQEHAREHGRKLVGLLRGLPRRVSAPIPPSRGGRRAARQPAKLNDDKVQRQTSVLSGVQDEQDLAACTLGELEKVARGLGANDVFVSRVRAGAMGEPRAVLLAFTERQRTAAPSPVPRQPQARSRWEARVVANGTLEPVRCAVLTCLTRRFVCGFCAQRRHRRPPQHHDGKARHEAGNDKWYSIVYGTPTCRRSSDAQIQAHTRLNLVSKHGVLVPCSRVELPKPLAVDVQMAIAVDSARQLELASRPDNAQHLDRALHVLHELLVRLLACLALLWQGQPPVQYLVECHACGLRNKSEVMKSARSAGKCGTGAAPALRMPALVQMYGLTRQSPNNPPC